MKKIILIGNMLFICLVTLVSAQSDDDSCGFIADEEYLSEWSDPNSFKNERLKFLEEKTIQEIYMCEAILFENGVFDATFPIQAEDSDEQKKEIPIVAHVVRQTSGKGGISDDDIKASIKRVNNFFTVLKAEFKLCEIKYIDDDAIYKHQFSGTADNDGLSGASYKMLDVENRNVSNKLNIYFVPKSNTSWAWRPNKNKKNQHILMLNSQAKNNSSLSHEIGHWFDLMHTHGPSRQTDELVDGTNCKTAGDLVCDTPADPNLSGLVDTNCIYTGRGKDDNDEVFAPDTRNIMAYTHKPCRKRFSEGQVKRMLAAYKGMKNDRGYTFTTCPSPIKAPTPDPIDIDWRVTLQPPASSANDPAWASCLAVLLSWRDGVTYTPLDVATSTGSLVEYFTGLSPDIDKLDASGLMVEPPTSYSVQGLAQMLEYGPLWSTSSNPIWGNNSSNNIKSRVILGMIGDGTPQGTQLTLYDPTSGSTGGEISMSYEKYITEVESKWQMPIPSAVYIVHP